MSSHRDLTLPKFVYNPELNAPDAESRFAGELVADGEGIERAYMPDEVTRDFARRMHYAAFRAQRARHSRTARFWLGRYYRLRDAIVLGNRKLIFKAVRRCHAATNYADDLIGECHLVMIHAVAAYNPWLGIRFSTYAFVSLLRALSRLSQRLAGDRLSRALSLAAHDGILARSDVSAVASHEFYVDPFLADHHPLLSAREKAVIRRRFVRPADQPMPTLADVGRDMGLSQERVRQVQLLAFDKLRTALRQ